MSEAEYLHSESGRGGRWEGDTVRMKLLHCHHIATHQTNHTVI